MSCAAEMLRKWVREAEGEGLTSTEREQLKALAWENRELKRAREILRLVLPFFA